MNKKDIVGFANKKMTSLKFVKWDRYIDAWSESKTLIFYGWIDRDDNYKDFIILNVNPDSFFHLTSSAKYDKKIAKILKADNPKPCKRIEKLLPNLVNAIKLKREKYT